MKRLLIEKFGGINTGNTPRKYEATNALNVRVDEGNLFCRPGTASYGDIGAGKVRKLFVIQNTLFAVQENGLKRWNGSAWISAGLNGFDTEAMPQAVVFPASSGVNLHTGTITLVEEGAYLVQDSTKTFEENALVNYCIKIVSGKGAGQVRKIVANTGIDILIADPWYITPEGSSYAIQSSVETNIFTNGVASPKRSDDTLSNVWNDMLDVPFFDFLIEYKGRLIGARRDARTVYISTLKNAEDFPFLPEIPKDEGSITGLVKFGNQLIVFLNNSVWVTEFESPTEIEFIQRTENYGCINSETIAVGEGFLFFLSDRGIEVFNTLETKLLEGHVAFSDYRMREIRDWDKSKASGVAFGGKYYCAIGDKTVVFDTLYYLRSLEIGQGGDYAFLIDTGYINDCFAVHEGTLYSGGDGKVVEHSADFLDDDSVPFESFWEKRSIDLGEPMRRKALMYLTAEVSVVDPTETLQVIAKGESEERSLDPMPLGKAVIQVSGKRTHGKSYTLRLNMNLIKRAKLKNLECIFEMGKM